MPYVFVQFQIHTKAYVTVFLFLGEQGFKSVKRSFETFNYQGF